MKKYDNFFLLSDDLAKAKDYYANTLGMPMRFDFPELGMIAFNVGSEGPAIYLKDVNKAPESKTAIWFKVDDVKEEYARLKEKGVNFLSEPFEIYTGMAVEFEDPFGNRLGITDYTKYNV